MDKSSNGSFRSVLNFSVLCMVTFCSGGRDTCVDFFLLSIVRPPLPCSESDIFHEGNRRELKAALKAETCLRLSRLPFYTAEKNSNVRLSIQRDGQPSRPSIGSLIPNIYPCATNEIKTWRVMKRLRVSRYENRKSRPKKAATYEARLAREASF